MASIISVFQCAYFLFFNLLQLAVFSFYYETPTGFRSYFY